MGVGQWGDTKVDRERAREKEQRQLISLINHTYKKQNKNDLKTKMIESNVAVPKNALQTMKIIINMITLHVY